MPESWLCVAAEAMGGTVGEAVLKVLSTQEERGLEVLAAGAVSTLTGRELEALAVGLARPGFGAGAAAGLDCFLLRASL